MPQAAAATIVVIDDDKDHLRLVATLLTGAGFQVRAFRESYRALENIDSNRPDLVITDIFMPFVDGFEVLRHVKHVFPEIPVMTMTEALGGHGRHYLDGSVKQGASMAFQKPIAPSELLDHVRRQLTWQRGARRSSQACE
jgi:two-component system response regulator VicR